MAREQKTQSKDGTYPTDGVSSYPVRDVAAAWERERPGTPVSSIGIVTPIWRLAKLLGDDRRRILAQAEVDAATLDLLSVLRRSGPPYTLSTRELSRRSLVTAGAVSQRVARAEREGLVTRRPGEGRPRSVQVMLTPTGHDLVERTVDQVLGREAQLISSLNTAQQAQLAELLQALLRDVQYRLDDHPITHVGDEGHGAEGQPA
ncbi:MarR family winged helix-turn-helix transcriptional regulator [Streptomyces candidus]|uniref:DNA-binding MarR family transcriptional regulator n=1 Tax=Streptomyces candidus TaxID=67283 RepID=A0A7X0HJW2_9ACTN|nr:MarR family transcriptional regulator [Streptomyces candidus]MBB6439029.1 DNA-binding MarR family transcriptional regulator [Streptomyces candidus]GHH44678.1 MarR family transcriptional regulator [Streptomyces candidus]